MSCLCFDGNVLEGTLLNKTNTSMNPQGSEVTEHVSGKCHSHEKDRPLWALHFSLFWKGAFLKVEQSKMPKIQLQSICSILNSFKNLQMFFFFF